MHCMIESFTMQTFAPYVGDTFHVLEGSVVPIELKLRTATALGREVENTAAFPSQRIPFSLVFHGPGGPHLPQKIYRLAHTTLGTFELFLVPIGPDTQGMRYEAIFT